MVWSQVDELVIAEVPADFNFRNNFHRKTRQLLEYPPFLTLLTHLILHWNLRAWFVFSHNWLKVQIFILFVTWLNISSNLQGPCGELSMKYGDCQEQGEDVQSHGEVGWTDWGLAGNDRIDRRTQRNLTIVTERLTQKLMTDRNIFKMNILSDLQVRCSLNKSQVMLKLYLSRKISL